MSVFCKLNDNSYFADTNRSIATCVPNKRVQPTDDIQTLAGTCKVYDFARLIQVGKQVADGDIDVSQYFEDTDDLEGAMQNFVNDMKFLKDTNVKCNYQVGPDDEEQIDYTTTSTTGTIPKGFYSVSVKKGVNPNLPKGLEMAYMSRALGAHDSASLGQLNQDINKVYSFSLLNAPVKTAFPGNKEDEGQEEDETTTEAATATSQETPTALPSNVAITQPGSASGFWESVRYTILISVVVFVLILTVLFIILVIMYSQSGTQSGGVFMRIFR